MKDYLAKVDETSRFLKTRLEENPEVGLITGTGLGDIADLIDVTLSLDYSEIPHFPSSTVVSHQGNLIFGQMAHQRLMALQGRFHLYEGYSSKEVTFPIRVMQVLGIEFLIVTNAAGGLNQDFNPGDIMIITDHINLTGANPLIGPNNDNWGKRFPDMSRAYEHNLSDLARKAAEENGVAHQTGIYAGLQGPSLETPAEVRFLKTIGADAVGFSTVQEVIAGVHASMKVLGLSIITNVHYPDDPSPSTVEEIISVAQKAAPGLEKLIRNVLEHLDDILYG